jgi:flagellar protein FliO/FliZ
MELWESVVRMGSALAVVLGLMLLLVVIARRLNLKGVLEPAQATVRVLGSGAVGPRKSILLVSVAGECLIVGSTANDLVPLGRIEDRAQVERLLGHLTAESAAPPVAPGFARVMQQFGLSRFTRVTERSA